MSLKLRPPLDPLALHELHLRQVNRLHDAMLDELAEMRRVIAMMQCAAAQLQDREPRKDQP